MILKILFSVLFLKVTYCTAYVTQGPPFGTGSPVWYSCVWEVGGMGQWEGELSVHSTDLQHTGQRGLSAPEGVGVRETRALSPVIWVSHAGHSAPWRH